MENTNERLGVSQNSIINSNGLVSRINHENYGKQAQLLKANLGDNILKLSNIVDNCDLIKSGVSIADRRAIKCGFNAPKLSNPCFSFNALSGYYNTMSSDKSPNIESPILLPNSQLSPTTGSFTPYLHDGNTKRDGNTQIVSTSLVDVEDGNNDNCSIMFNPHTTALSYENIQVSSNGSGIGQNLVANNECQSLTSLHSKTDFEYPIRSYKEFGIEDFHYDEERKISNNVENPNSSFEASLQNFPKNGPYFTGEDGDYDGSGSHDSLDGNPNRVYPRAGAGPGPISTGEDGYNWRKYGQKHVKGSKHPRSYYKCTHQTCQMKKVVECSSDGQITEIVYKGGVHDHSKPQTCRRSSFLPFNEASKIIVDYCDDSCMEAASSASLALGIRQSKFDRFEPELSSDLHSTTRGNPTSVLGPRGLLEFSSTPLSHEVDKEDVATQGSFFIGYDNENEPDTKRRKKENCFVVTNYGSRAIREPKVVLKIETEVDILDDGYRWCKYGQKVVKGNPNPRSYYKCTVSECPVRKHVERSAESKKFVLVTYEAKHNHAVPVPAARNRGHSNSGTSSSNLRATSTVTQSTLATPTNYYHIPKREPYTHNFPLQFDPILECDNQFLGPNSLGNFSVGSSWFYDFYPMKLPAFPDNTPYSPPYGLNGEHPVYVNSNLPPIRNLSLPIPPKFPNPMSGHCNTEMSYSPAQSLYAEQQLKESNDKLLTPKWEQRDNLFFETDSRSINRTDASSSTANNQSMRTY